MMKATFAKRTVRRYIGLIAWYTAANATFCRILTIISKHVSIAGI